MSAAQIALTAIGKNASGRGGGFDDGPGTFST
jgi:hypothetical protein